MEYAETRGVRVPKVGLGTWRLTGAECRETVETALDLGYRHVDTAQYYGNEEKVGQAIEYSDVDRADVFLTTKLKPSNLTRDAVFESVAESLRKLRTDYVDLLLIHRPNRRVAVAETVDAMNTLQEEGRVEHVGVSNFDTEQIESARVVSRTPLLTNQVQFHPYKAQDEMLRYCHERDVLLTAYSPLGHGGVLSDDRLREIGARYGKSPVQVALRWVIQHDGTITIPKATGREHLAANLDVFDFELTGAEMRAVARPSRFRTVSNLVRSRLPF